MLCNINMSAIVYPLLMLLVGMLSLAVNVFLAKKSNDKFKREQMDKKADKIYVDDKLKSLDREFCIKLQSYSESTEETRTLLENMSKQVNWIYQKHYK